MTNLISNGDFSSGLSGWSATSPTMLQTAQTFTWPNAVSVASGQTLQSSTFNITTGYVTVDFAVYVTALTSQFRVQLIGASTLDLSDLTRQSTLWQSSPINEWIQVHSDRAVPNGNYSLIITGVTGTVFVDNFYVKQTFPLVPNYSFPNTTGWTITGGTIALGVGVGLLGAIVITPILGTAVVSSTNVSFF